MIIAVFSSMTGPSSCWSGGSTEGSSKHQLKSFEEYYRFLRYDRKREEEMVVLVDNLTTNETYFFREGAQLKAFSDEIIPSFDAGTPGKRACASGAPGARPVRNRIRSRSFCWSPAIGGATGRWRSWGATSTSVSCTRHEKECTRKAPTGRRRPICCGSILSRKAKGDYRIIDAVRQLVSFSYVNLLDPFKISLIRDLDLIFLQKRHHLLRSKRQEEGDRNILRQAAGGRLPPSRTLGISHQHFQPRSPCAPCRMTWSIKSRFA